MLGELHVETDSASGGVRFFGPARESAVLHPLWLRERSMEAGCVDPDNHQRLYEPWELPADLRVESVRIVGPDRLALSFSDGHRCRLDVDGILIELGWMSDPEAPPAPEPWDSNLAARPEASWMELDDPARLQALLGGFFRYGFCILHATPVRPGALAEIAGRFGFLRDTNFGSLFDVMSKPNPSDLAYTGSGILAHSDNPYRHPVPGIQLLHCLVNEAEGGLSTLVDGLRIAQELERLAPEEAEVLASTPVRFRYHSDVAIMESRAPLLQRDAEGRIVQVRLSSRLDYVPPMEPDRLEIFFSGRRRLHRLAGNPRFEIRFRLRPGMVLMMDNHRLLHGRTAFDHLSGRRHLQGGYIDHDGPESLYRMLRRGVSVVAVGRDVA
ncbi:MAG: TauD/TfdA family dioxygenase [Rhodovibrionaceae bacterium]|nr:TauD/TfdA family dioxygenase [Rhodovibrionaceae bacterium]